MNDSKKQGWIRIHRIVMESSVWKSPVIWMIWCWCLLKSNHKRSVFPFNGSDIELLPGQFITGRESAIKELGTLTPQQWRTAIKYLKSTSRITVQSNNKFSLITVLKWEEYQSDNQQTNQRVTNEQPATNQRVTTNKNVNNVKNVKNTTTSDEVAGIPEVIKVFKDSLSPSLNYGNKTQRSSSGEMIKKYGLENTLEMCKVVIAVQGKKYAPRASTPHAMWIKLGDFKSYFDAEKNKQPKVVSV